jgi:predicted PhzF superfamily epimerase YddE/YHI9
MNLELFEMLIYFVVHSFTDKIFCGNPAGVCPLDSWIDDTLMQQIAAENNLSETAFFVPKENHYELRWFTPKVEVDLCGHATLATAYVLFDHLGYEGDAITFETKSGDLTVCKHDDFMIMDFPSRLAKKTEIPEHLFAGLGREVERVFKARDYLIVLESEKEVRDLRPDVSELEKIDCEGVIVTAPGDDVDFVSRFFAPRMGISEDPVTGAAHSTLTPYWAERLGKNQLTARQVSERGGDLWCKQEGDRVQIAGHAALYVKGFLNIE